MTSSTMHTDHWHYFHGKPTISAVLKATPADFTVKEILTFEPLGEGEHVLVWLRKTELNTAFVAEQLAKFAQIPLRNVSYAGRKDKFAVTEQWFSLHMPGKDMPNWAEFNLPGAEVLKTQRHHKKLRPGNLDCNLFQITLRNLSNTDGLVERLEKIKKEGVPNYFGPQRFGEIRLPAAPSDAGLQTSSTSDIDDKNALAASDTPAVTADTPAVKRRGGNLELAQKMIDGETIRNRNKRSMAISALRSWLFNEFIHGRIEYSLAQKCPLQSAMKGDLLMLNGSNSFFKCEEPDAMIQARLNEQDIQLSAPLWGKGELGSSEAALALESSIATAHPAQCALLETLGLKQERRPIWLFPLKMHWELNGDTLSLAFYLPPGCFATSVLRELVTTD